MEIPKPTLLIAPLADQLVVIRYDKCMHTPSTYEMRLKQKMKQLKWQVLHIDPFLLFTLLTLATLGIFILYSASNANVNVVEKQLLRLVLSFGLLFLFAQIPPHRYKQWAPWMFGTAFTLLLLVLFIGKVDLGAKRWLSLGIFRFQPSEMMKLAMPMMLAWYLSEKNLTLNFRTLLLAAMLILAPVALIIKEPDLGTAIIVTLSGFFVLLLAGLRWRLIALFAGFFAMMSPIIWHFMHAYQKQRVLTFLNPERDPLGSGYHIIQSKIAIGSGGLLGKGWLNGTQSHLSFLPEHTTDFIFAVSAEELGLIGGLLILLIFLVLFARCLYISNRAQNNFTRLLAGSLTLTFITSAFINLSMVIGILPVVGIPLPLISYGGSSMMTLMIGFGIIMSIQTHRRLWQS